MHQLWLVLEVAAALRCAPPAMQAPERLAPIRVEAAAAAARAALATTPPRPPAMSHDAEEDATRVLVQGGSLRTWSFQYVEQMHITINTEGRPLDAGIELWHGPDNNPATLRVYSEDGQLGPFSAVIQAPCGPNTVAIRNINQIEYPFAANVISSPAVQPSSYCTSIEERRIIQGEAVRTYPFTAHVDSVEILLQTDGRPLNARVELLQGPNNVKQVVELYTEDGSDRPFFCVLETPGSGNVVRIVNTAPVEFPITAAVVPQSISEDMATGAVISGDVVVGGSGGFSGFR